MSKFLGHKNNAPLLILYVCLLSLAACFGGGGNQNDSSVGKKKVKTQNCSKEIINGTGVQKWDSKAKAFSFVCEINGCDGGFYHEESLGLCLETVVGYYSPIKSKKRESCPSDPPNNATLVTDTAGLTARHECWTCKDGFVKNEKGNCVPPSEGKFVNEEGAEVACSPIVGEGFKSFSKNTTGNSSPEKCKFSCKSSFFKNEAMRTCDRQKNSSRFCQVSNGKGIRIGGGRCQIIACSTGYDNVNDRVKCEETPSGFYSAAGHTSRTTCPNPFNSLATEAIGLSSPYDCYSCELGYRKMERGSGLCVLPFRGKFVDSVSGQEKECTPIQGEGFKSFIKNSEGAAADDECDFVCKNKFKKDIAGRSCVKIAVTKTGDPKATPEVTSDQACSILNGIGRKFCVGEDCGNCEIQRCSKGYKPNTSNEEQHVCIVATKDCSSEISNGKGKKRWNVEDNVYKGCKVVQCSVGYVDKRTSCAIPVFGKYADKKGKEKSCESLNGTGTGSLTANTGAVRKATGCNFTCDSGFVKNEAGFACNIPGLGKYVDGGVEKNCNSVIGTGTGSLAANTGAVSSDTGCNFTCDSGFVKDESGFACNIPGLGKYVDGGVVKSCNSVIGTGTGSLAANTGAVSSDTGCDFICDPGFVKDEAGFACNIPGLGKYVDGGVVKSCNRVIGTGTGSLTANTGAVSSNTGCNFTCNPGFVKDESGFACNIPGLGKYADAGVEKRCNNVIGTGTGSLAANTGAVSSDTGCNFTCDPGFVKDESGFACNIPGLGKYADAGVEKRCNNVIGTGTGSLAANTGAVSSDTGCNFTCDPGFVKDESGFACNIPGLGKYVDGGVVKNCNNIIGTGTGNLAANTGAVSSDTGCNFTCDLGFVKDVPGFACNIPGLGKYADAGVEKNCNNIIGTGTGSLAANTGAVSSDTGCNFTCDSGFVKDEAGFACNIPGLGKYVKSDGTQADCTDITGVTGFGVWEAGAAAADDACPFSCLSGFAVNGRVCDKAQPQAVSLALGSDNSYVLFDNGELERWEESVGIPHKVDLGSRNNIKNLAQAVFSGLDHRCVILKNGNLKHGRVMCWGDNDKEQLGVGDTNNRSTPTDVSATVLSKTAKSLAFGYDHTCALLNDDTVRCWGRDDALQIGGGTTTQNPEWRIASGAQNDPLSGGTAVDIAAGGQHSCAILANGSVKCWGREHKGQTGGGTPSLGPNRTAVRLALGEIYSCAILDNGRAYCWGGGFPPDSTPYTGPGGVPVLGLNKTAVDISAGINNTCAVLNDKTVKCWGVNDTDELGGGVPDYQDRILNSIYAYSTDKILRGSKGNPLNGAKAVNIAMGGDHGCAIVETDHSVKCWGRNNEGQAVGAVTMKGGDDGQGQSQGESSVLTADATPTSTALEADSGGILCRLTLSGGTLQSSSWSIQDHTNLAIRPTYNNGNNTSVSDAIDNLITEIGQISVMGAGVTLSRSGTNKIAAAVDKAILNGMTLSIGHDDNGGNCSNPKGTTIALSGGSGAVQAKGLWAVKNHFIGFGDDTVNVDFVDIKLGNSMLTQEEIADRVVGVVNTHRGWHWPGRRHESLPYTATKLNGTADGSDKCPADAFCVVFTRFFAGTSGNTGIPMADSDYDAPSAAALATTASCGAGLIKNLRGSGSCDNPASGKYADASGREDDCNAVSGGGFNAFEPNTGAVASATGCAFSCRAGYLKGAYDCNEPGPGKYVDASNILHSCNNITRTRGATITWESGPAADAGSCPFSCSGGYLANFSGKSCDFPTLGNYVDVNGTQKFCDPVTVVQGAISIWKAGAAASKTACPFSCSSGYFKNARSCSYPTQGNYIKPDGTQNGCKTISGGNFGSWKAGPADDSNSCPFSCQSGYVVNDGNRSCDIPDEGMYADNTGQEVNCSGIGGVAEASLWVQSQNGVASATACPFQCADGYVKDSGNRTCQNPTPGKYVDGSTQKNCNPITVDQGGFVGWVPGPATASDACPFTCNTGYVVEKRTCEKKKNKALSLALGLRTGYVLLDSGEVEGFGRTSDPSAIPLKVDLGKTSGTKNTAQAIAAGPRHQCVILANGNNDYGKLKCWGRNTEFQLGTGDAKDRDVPIEVTHFWYTSLGGALTVKAVSVGGKHTCVIKDDDTVACWGDSNYAQVGGDSGRYRTDRVLMGTASDPLAGRTTVKIAAGSQHSCAVLSDGTVKCWGYDLYGQSTVGSSGLGAGRRAVEIAAGHAHTCAVLDNGTVKCWGGYDPDGSSRVRISMNIPDFGGKSVVGITGSDHTCAVLNDKTVKCWGRNDNGEIGGGTAGVGRILSGSVGDPLSGRRASFVVAGRNHSCAILEPYNSVKCWGTNESNQFIGSVKMRGGSDGTGISVQSKGETSQLTANSTPTSTALGSDTSAMLCKITLSGGTLGSAWSVGDYTNQIYNSSNGTLISDAIDNLISDIGGPISFAGANISFSKSSSGDKIEANVDLPLFVGMDINILHSATSCNSPVTTSISVSGGSGATLATGFWAVKDGFSGNGDGTIRLDNVDINLGNAPLTTEGITDKVVQEITGSWTGEQYGTLPYKVSKVNGSSNTTDDCPNDDFCVLFTRVFPGEAGSNGIRFPDSDYDVPSAAALALNCQVGEVRNLQGDGSCDIPELGMYADNNGVEESCTPIGGVLGASRWIQSQNPVTSATTCPFECLDGYLTAGRSCDYPTPGNYVTAGGTETVCTDLSGITGFNSWVQGPADDVDSCSFSCQSGYVVNGDGRTCDLPDSGMYVDVNGREVQCTDIGGVPGAFRWSGNTNPVSSATSCPFECLDGYLTAGRVCNYPTLGNYVTSNGTEALCTDLSGITGFNAWEVGPADDGDSCPFACNKGYVVDGNTCVTKQVKPVALALGSETSYVLFDNGKVEGWGATVDSSAIPLKINLGKTNGTKNTAQAVAAGGDHQCVILTNGIHKHGPMKCWGENHSRELGVGDRDDRSLPTDVTILGSKTAQAVVIGDQHTCAILNDDTVKCWGAEDRGQIGGSASAFGPKVELGTKGDPLDGAAATRIAVGIEHTCAVLSDGTVRCWGADDHGKSDGKTNGSPSLGTGKRANDVAAGREYSCALLDDGTVTCWGNITPNIGGKSIRMASGATHICVVLDDNTLKCRGNNTYAQTGGGIAKSCLVGGQLTANCLLPRGSATTPLGGMKVRDVSGGQYHTCAIMESDDSIKCWGRNIESQLVGAVKMRGGFDGSGTSLGRTVALTTDNTPSPTALGKNARAKICEVTLSGGGLSSPWILKSFNNKSYNYSKNISISKAVSNVISAIGLLKFAGAHITLSKTGKKNKIEATVDRAFFAGMNLNIFHTGTNCSSSVETTIPLSRGAGATRATGLWVVKHDFIGSGDTTLFFDNVEINLGTSVLTKKEVADKVVLEITDDSWTGGQSKRSPYTATALSGSSDANDDCPAGDYCIVFKRLFPGKLGNNGIRFPDSDYERPSSDALALTCQAGTIKNLQGNGSCDIPGPGKYVDASGIEAACDPVAGVGVNSFEANTGSVSTSKSCAFSCQAGYIKKTADYMCDYPQGGFYVDTNSGNEVACNDISGVTGFQSWQRGAATGTNSCPFSCQAGFVVNRPGGTCDIPSSGMYADASGLEATCTDIGGASTGFQWTQSSNPVASADTCPYTCRSGFTSDDGNRECNYPREGYYTDGTSEMTCDPITVDINGFDTFVEGHSASSDSCPFRCHRGYIVQGRTCHALSSIKPVALALGDMNSFVLFNSGEVEAWGETADPSKIPFKVDLGITNGMNNTAQAISAAKFHRCVILTNDSFDHGPVRCWGTNSSEQLGVGDRGRRSVPTKVTALGVDTTNNSYTAKALATGAFHTCALLNDDTVKCWGGNYDAQIGGTIRGTGNVESGVIGDPLESVTIVGIAAGFGHNCTILKSNNMVKCWGWNHKGQAGGGTPSLGSGRHAIGIAAGFVHSCALLDNKSVKCWGDNDSVTTIGQGGVPNFGGTTALSVATGPYSDHTCSLLNDKTVKCWGVSDKGQIGGNATTSDASYIKRGTAGLPLNSILTAKVAVGADHTCAILTDDTIKCWGQNDEGQLIGAVGMEGGLNGSGPSTGKTGTLLADSTPSSTALDTDTNGKLCRINLSGGDLGSPWTLKEYGTTYNTSNNTPIADAIDNLISAIGTSINFQGAEITFSRKNSKIEAAVDIPVFDGMTLGLVHADSSGNCSNSVTTEIVLSGGSGAVKPEGLWVVNGAFAGGSDNNTIHLDGVEIDLGTSGLTKEGLVDTIVQEISVSSWAGKQYNSLPYTASKQDGSSDTGDDCPNNDFCVVFTRVFDGAGGNTGIPFPDSDYKE